MKVISVNLLTLILLVSVSFNNANAALLPRLGGLAVYDTDLNLTWLADANAIAGTPFDDGTNTTNGWVSWSSANAWAASLNVAGVTGWRLPTTLQPDTSCMGQTGGGTISVGANCTGSELGHLFYLELGGSNLPSPPPSNGILASGDADLALFSNIQSVFGQGGIYWSATEYNAANAWQFNFNNGLQFFEHKNGFGGHPAWAVHDGDVSPVPVPAAIWLFGSGLITLLGLPRVRGRVLAAS